MKTGKLPPTPEREIQKTGIQLLELAGFRMERRNVARQTLTDESGKTRVVRSGKTGQSDTYGWHVQTGLHIEIEWKRVGKRPSPEQLAWLKRCTIEGTIAFWCDRPELAVNIALACVSGAKIVWADDDYFDVLFY